MSQDAPPTAAQAEVYPNSDRGLLAMTERWADMTRDARLGTLRGIQEVAFRAGRKDAIVSMPTAAQARPTREPETERLRAMLKAATHNRGCYDCGRKADDIQLFGHEASCAVGAAIKLPAAAEGTLR